VNTSTVKLPTFFKACGEGFKLIAYSMWTVIQDVCWSRFDCIYIHMYTFRQNL